ncbi:acyl-CoA carboxylase epsilon subunit [Streptomyces sp. NPDC048611]|uniref:acyl-CoA carboxylase epsilon subunit n=1 Tax=Streptomyces sp. NPDC048611 TaxID=3155635 RepID=UPI0034298370
MSTSTDASTVLAEATRLAPGAPLEEDAADGTAPAGEGTTLNGAPPVEADRAADAGAAPDASVAADRSTASRDDPAAAEPAGDPATALDASAAVAELPVSWLRIEKGHAEPEEIAAISVVLCAQLAGLRARTDDGRPGEPSPGRRHPPRHSACWSGCWTCG